MSSTMGVEANLLSLPFELQLTIFSFLDVHSILVLSSLSNEFNNLAMCDAFYQTTIARECLLVKRCPNISKSDFIEYLHNHLDHASWKQIYKALVVLPYLERRFLAMIDFRLLWKSNEEVQYLPRLIRLETCIWVVCSKHYSLSTSIQDLEDTIIMGHHCFATLSQFFHLLIIKYCVPCFDAENPSTADRENIELIRSRVVAMIQTWVAKNSHDLLLNPALCTAIRQFVQYVVAPLHKLQLEKTIQLITPSNVQSHINHFNDSHKFMSTYGPNSPISRTEGDAKNSNSAAESEFDFRTITITSLIEEEGDEDYEKRNINEVNFSNLSPYGNAGTMRVAPMFSTSLDNSTLSILDCDVEVVAQELAWFDWELYSRVQISEVMDKSWRHANKLSFSPNIVASIRWFNHVSFWVATEVLNFPKVKQRTQALSTFMQIALKCYDFRDYHSVFSILAGLNMACIQRLHNSWAGMGKKLRDNFIRLSSFITGVNGDFLAYKSQLKNCELPAVPYLGCLLYDITFVLDTSENPKFPLIHLHKIAVMAKIVNEVARFQRIPYSSPPSLLYLGQLRNVKVLDAGELYRKSMELEPRRTSPN